MIRSSVQGTYTPSPISQKSLVYPKAETIVDMPDSSIKINMMSLEAVSEEQSKEEEETIETLTSFVPLSTTPAPGMIVEDDFDIRDRIRSDEEVHDAHVLANRKIKTQSRWKVWFSFLVIGLALWAGFVSINKSSLPPKVVFRRETNISSERAALKAPEAVRKRKPAKKWPISPNFLTRVICFLISKMRARYFILATSISWNF